MNFLFTVALNTVDGEGYKTIMQLFRSLAITLNKLGHNTFILTHPAAYMHYAPYTSVFKTGKFDRENYKLIMTAIGFVPDYAFIWNGNASGDATTINLLKSNGVKIIYGELGFFKHFEKTCYFDLGGVNCKITDISDDISSRTLDDEECKLLNTIVKDNIQPRKIDKPYIFVPLQVESDTQIVKYSPFKTMQELLEYVNDIFIKDNRPIYFKQHPLKKSEIKIYNKMHEVSGDVHHYIPYADVVVGINSTVLAETLIYHNKVICLGAGVSSKHFVNDEQRKRYILQLYKKQVNWEDLINKDKVENSYFYNEILKDYAK